MRSYMKRILFVYFPFKSHIVCPAGRAGDEEVVSLELKQLAAFVAVAEEGTISAAARRLHMTQPPLSHQLKLLEEELSLTLFERGARKVTLTPAGELFYPRAANILEMARVARKELSDLAVGKRGTLRLGTVSSSGSALLSSRIREFHALYPDVDFSLHEGNTYQLLELLRAGIIEVAVARTPFQAEGFHCSYLSPEPMVAVAGPAHPWPGEGALSLTYLKGRPLILYRRFEDLIARQCAAAGFAPTVLCKNDDARTTLMWVGAGLGVALVPRSALKIMQGLQVSCREIDDPALTTQIAAVWAKNRPLSPPAQGFVEVFSREREV